MTEIDNEFEAIQTVYQALAPLDEEGRSRVLKYIASRLGIDARVSDSPTMVEDDDVDEGDEGEATETNGSGAAAFSDFAELYAKAEPKSNAERALVAGYWLQECQQAGSFTGAAANKELNHLGYKVGNITQSIDRMRNRKPELILQLRKSGRSQQARKLYKVSREGVRRVEEMVGE